MKNARSGEDGKRTGKRLPLDPPFFYGWVMVGIGAMSLFFSGIGQSYSLSVFIDRYLNDFAWDRTFLSGMYSLATVCSGSLLFVIGRWTDRFGSRHMLAWVGLLMGLACFWNSVVAGPIMMFIGLFLLRFFGQGALAIVPNTLVPQWFVRYRGRALSFMALGHLIGASAFPIVNHGMIELWGWPVAWRVWGAVLLAVFVPAVYILVRNCPEEVGLQPDGTVDPTKPGEKKRRPQSEASWHLSEAVRTGAFWVSLFSVFVIPFVITAVIFHLFSILGQQGFSRSTAAFALGTVPLIGFFCTLLFGFVVEKVRVQSFMAVTFLLMLGMLGALFRVSSWPSLVLFVALWGVLSGMIKVSLEIVWPSFFGREHLGSIRSIGMSASVFGSAAGPVPLGWAFDRWGTYSPMIALLMILPLTAMLGCLLTPSPQKKVPEAE